MAFLKTFWSEDYHYYSSQSVPALRADIKALMEQPWSWDMHPRGYFIGEDVFHLSHQFAFKGGHFLGNTSDLTGQIFPGQQRTIVRFSVRPNPVFAFFFFLTLLFLPFIITGTGMEGNSSLVARIVLSCLCPIIPFAYAYFAKHNLKDRFISIFQLFPLSEEEDTY